MENYPLMAHWHLVAYGNDVILNGTVYGHPSIADGRKINTSPLVNGQYGMNDGQEALYFSTKNTVYYCPMEEVDPSCQLTKKYLIEQIPQEMATWDKWLDGNPARPLSPFANINIPVPEGSYLLALDAGCPYLFYGMFRKVVGGYYWEQREPFVQLGMFTDSVICRGKAEQELLYDIRYFPMENYRFRFYELNIPSEDFPYFVINIGKEPILYGRVQEEDREIAPWHMVQIPYSLSPEQQSQPQLEELQSNTAPELSGETIEEEQIPEQLENPVDIPSADIPPVVEPVDFTLSEDSLILEFEEELEQEMNAFQQEVDIFQELPLETTVLGACDLQIGDVPLDTAEEENSSWDEDEFTGAIEIPTLNIDAMQDFTQAQVEELKLD